MRARVTRAHPTAGTLRARCERVRVVSADDDARHDDDDEQRHTLRPRAHERLWADGVPGPTKYYVYYVCVCVCTHIYTSRIELHSSPTDSIINARAQRATTSTTHGSRNIIFNC